ncbi:MAG: hypothetical protein ABI766_13300 [Gemmatimonadales bacterium]
MDAREVVVDEGDVGVYWVDGVVNEAKAGPVVEGVPVSGREIVVC